MPLREVIAGDDRALQAIADALAKSHKQLLVTGAGISTSCGIPVCSTLSPVLCLKLTRAGFQIKRWTIQRYTGASYTTYTAAFQSVNTFLTQKESIYRR